MRARQTRVTAADVRVRGDGAWDSDQVGGDRRSGAGEAVRPPIVLARVANGRISICRARIYCSAPRRRDAKCAVEA